MRKDNLADKQRNPHWGKIGYAAYLLAFLCVGTVFGWAKNSSLMMKAMTDPAALFFNNPQKAFDNHDTLQILLLGCDEDRVSTGYHTSKITRSAARTDMMMVARLDFKNGEITGLSIPRDTECSLPGYGRHKINAYFSIAKSADRIDLTKKAVEYMLPGLKIDKVVAIDFSRFQQLVDLVGGVDMNIASKMDYDDFAGELHIHFKPGQQHLDGHTAIELVRFRHNDEGDFGRQQRQRDFLLALKASAIRNWLKLPQIAEQGKQVLDNAFTDSQVLALAAFSKKVPPNQIKMTTLPTSDGPGTYLRLKKKEAAVMLADLGFVPKAANAVAAVAAG